MEDKILESLQEVYQVIKNIPSEIGMYDSRPVFVQDKELIKHTIVTESLVVYLDKEDRKKTVNLLIRSYSPTFYQKDEEGYFYMVYWNINS